MIPEVGHCTSLFAVAGSLDPKNAVRNAACAPSRAISSPVLNTSHTLCSPLRLVHTFGKNDKDTCMDHRPLRCSGTSAPQRAQAGDPRPRWDGKVTAAYDCLRRFESLVSELHRYIETPWHAGHRLVALRRLLPNCRNQLFQPPLRPRRQEAQRS